MISVVLATCLADRELKNRVNATRTMGSKELVLGGKVSLRNVHNRQMPLERFCKTPGAKKLVRKGIILLPILHYLITYLDKKNGPVSRLGSSLLLGGALGNWSEHLEAGYATDYITLEAAPGKLRRIVFNLADAAIILGTLLSFLAVLFRKNR